MDTKLMLQLLQNKTGEIQSLLEYFNNQPSEELEKGFELLAVRIENLNKEFQILRNIFSQTDPAIPEIKEIDFQETAPAEKIDAKPIEKTTGIIESVEIESPVSEIKEEKKESEISTDEKEIKNQKEQIAPLETKVPEVSTPKTVIPEEPIAKTEESVPDAKETEEINCEKESSEVEENIVEPAKTTIPAEKKEPIIAKEDVSAETNSPVTTSKEETTIIEKKEEIISQEEKIELTPPPVLEEKAETVIEDKTTPVVEEKTEPSIEKKEEAVVEKKTELIAEEKEDDENVDLSTLNDKLNEQHSTLIGENISASKLEDIQTAIGINDKFLFIRELFESDYEAYQNAVEFINKTNNYTEVKNWIDSQSTWDMESASVNQFVDIIKRKF